MPFPSPEPGAWRLSGEVRAALGGALVAAMLVVIVATRIDSAGGTRGTPVTAVGLRTLPAYWVVHPGDTFALIARRTGLSVPAIEGLNPDADPGALDVGQHVALRRP